MLREQDRIIREHVLKLLGGGGAHPTLEEALGGFPIEMRGRQVKGFPWSAWQLLEHIRIAQWDILEFSRNPQHQSPDWPDGYWPVDSAPEDESGWIESVMQVKADLQALCDLLTDPERDLYAPFEHGDGQTLLREALLAADHTAYHLGQFVMLRKMLGIWPPDES